MSRIKQAHVVLEIDVSGYIAALAKLQRSVDRYERVWLNRWIADTRPHCFRNDFSNPAPLTIDGHAYARRRKNRKGRR